MCRKGRDVMSYSYSEERPKLFSEKGSMLYIAIRDRVNRLLKEAGAVRMAEATQDFTGDGWLMMACLDRMVEMGEIKEVTDDDVFGQDRIFYSLKD